MIALDINAVYTIELCSGELRQWKYLGQDSRRLVWWMDLETRQEFNESSLMYAWSVKERVASHQNAPDNHVDRTGRYGE
ncbi:hypothetical protein [Dechloromonas sp. H13]|uniref:hypothetical protein n=1 Tax=Dechloromonas sp. H13 TaxID=2570193 RepID=UPI001290D723|nr:hypothetical protein [Dechloromonas sp. H13]